MSTASLILRPLRASGLLTWNVSEDRKSTRLNSSHGYISYAVFCLKKKKHIAAALLPVDQHYHIEKFQAFDPGRRDELGRGDTRDHIIDESHHVHPRLEAILSPST